MTIPVSGPISLLQIYAEFGAPVGTPLTAMVRGGAYVANNAGNAGVPTAPPISMNNTRGASGVSSFAASKSGDADGALTLPEPAPLNQNVTSNNVAINCSGGTGSYSCTWSHLSGNATISTPGANNFNPSFSANVVKNSTISAVKRCAASDGVTTINVDVNVTLSYTAL